MATRKTPSNQEDDNSNKETAPAKAAAKKRKPRAKPTATSPSPSPGSDQDQDQQQEYSPENSEKVAETRTESSSTDLQVKETEIASPTDQPLEQLVIVRTDNCHPKIDINQSFPNEGGFILQANICTAIILGPGQRARIPTGLSFDLPDHLLAVIKTRPGRAFKQGLMVMNTSLFSEMGPDGETKVLLVNLGSNEILINPLEKIAALHFVYSAKVKFTEDRSQRWYMQQADGIPHPFDQAGEDRWYSETSNRKKQDWEATLPLPTILEGEDLERYRERKRQETEQELIIIRKQQEEKRRIREQEKD
jgi:dUTP pyrophosphatase